MVLFLSFIFLSSLLIHRQYLAFVKKTKPSTLELVWSYASHNKASKEKFGQYKEDYRISSYNVCWIFLYKIRGLTFNFRYVHHTFNKYHQRFFYFYTYIIYKFCVWTYIFIQLSSLVWWHISITILNRK